MIQKWYKAGIIAKFMSKEEMAEFDTRYQSVKAPTANNLGQKTLDQLVEKKVKEVLNGLNIREITKKTHRNFDF